MLPLGQRNPFAPAATESYLPIAAHLSSIPMHDDDDWEEEDSDDFGDDDEPTIACPHCRRQIHEDSQRCPYCEQYLSAEDSPPSRKPWWIIIGVIIALGIVLRWIIH